MTAMKKRYAARMAGDCTASFPCSPDWLWRLDRVSRELGAPNRRGLFTYIVGLLENVADGGAEPWDDEGEGDQA